MIISREEFHRRFNGFIPITTIKEKKELMSVERLFKEIQADAPFRNHEYMFAKGIDFDKLEIQEETVGIKKRFPKIKTEKQRLAKIKKELLADKYEPVPVFRDIDYPDVIYVNDGFHRIWLAHEIGWKVIKTKASYGKFNLSKSIPFEDLAVLLNMLEKLFDKDKKLSEVRTFVEKVVKKSKNSNKRFSIGYGNEHIEGGTE